MPAAYGGTTGLSVTRRRGVGGDNSSFTAHFTTANTAAPTIDSAKTRGVISIARTGVGVFRVTLPWKIRNSSVQITPFAYPSGAVVNAWKVAHTENTTTVDITVVVISTGAAGDTTGLELDVRIEGKAKG